MDKEFGKLKVTLGEYLTKDNCRVLCTALGFKPVEESRVLEANLPALVLFDQLVKGGKISPTNVKVLAEVLRECSLCRALEIVQEYASSIDQEESDDDGWELPTYDETRGTRDNNREPVTFRDFLETVGLGQYFPNKLSLDRFVQIKDPNLRVCPESALELFWRKISSLDYRIRSTKEMKLSGGLPSQHFSIRDFIFALLHCSDIFLRQDVIEKMSACNFAIPIILQGVDNLKPRFLSWSLRRIVKKWKGHDSVALEQHIIQWPTFTVAFIRIGEIGRVSKSAILNNLLGQYQGNDPHPFFVTNDEDAKSRFGAGCVECVWYLPMNTNGSEVFKWVTAFYNLRGDCRHFDAQTKFTCKAADLTVALIAEEHQEALKASVKLVRKNSNQAFFVVFRSAQSEPQLFNGGVFVSNSDLVTVNENISRKILQRYNECNQKTLKFRSHEQLKHLCKDDIEIEDNETIFDEVRQCVDKFVNIQQDTDITEYKRNAFPLQAKWREWIRIDKERPKPDSEREESFEYSRDNILIRKQQKREEQIQCGISETMKTFWNMLERVGKTRETRTLFLYYLQDALFGLVDMATRKHLEKIEEYDTKIQKLDKLIKPKADATISKLNKDEDKKHQATLDRHKQLREDWKRLKQGESEKCREKNIGWEHFLRELGQWHEAHNELKKEKDERIMSLPGIAAQLLNDGHSLEIMDGDTGRVPLSWVTSILDELTQVLDDPKILVLSVVGVQSSGKSTLLNSMFGVKFPVRAGRCTRGLFMRILHVHEAYSKQLGVRHIFLVDSEGVRSVERASNEEYRFDNELITLALCISDITILNIEGENIGPEMTGLLQIAAHALMRMKEVNPHSQCRIIQQRVSDLTASQRNKINMGLIVKMLNAAIVEAAKEEGFADRYQQFSDVFDLQIDENLQFIPCLWSGPMSPPCQFYSDVVSKLKENILSDVQEQKISPQFSVSTFTQRIQDVWGAVKEENFLFNFQDSVKAVDFNTLCMELNKSILKMRCAVGKKLVVWQEKLTTSHSETSKELERIMQECDEELEKQGKSAMASYKSFVQQYKRGDSLSPYYGWFKQSIEHTVGEIKTDSKTVLESDAKMKKQQGDIITLTAKMRSKFRQLATAEAGRARSLTSGPNVPRNPEKIFAKKWDEWSKDVINGMPPNKISEGVLMAACENLLLSITSDMAVSTEIGKLIKEFGIQKHSENVDWKKFYPDKAGHDAVDKWFSDNEKVLQESIAESSREMEQSSSKRFDANLIQCVLRNALLSMSMPMVTSEPPYHLKAKLLLHICGRIYITALRNQRLYEAENDFEKLLVKEKNSLREDFLAVFKRENQLERVIECLRGYLVQWCYEYITSCFIQDFLLRMTSKGYLINMSVSLNILTELAQQPNVNGYIKYLENAILYKKGWILSKAVEMCCDSTSGIAVLRQQSEALVDQMIFDIYQVLTTSSDLSKHNTQDRYKEFLDIFIRELMSRGFPRHQELAAELHSFSILNVDKFVSEAQHYLHFKLKEDVLKRASFPDPSDKHKVNEFVQTYFGAEINNVIQQSFCPVPCPMCKAPCDNPMPLAVGHRDHFCITHLSRGITGKVKRNTTQLVIDNCSDCVVSQTSTYSYPGVKTPRLCKNYKTDFPTWDIGPYNRTPFNHTVYWKWVMVLHNDGLAEYYKCKPAEIPQSWQTITKEDALRCLTLAVAAPRLVA